MSVSRTAAHTDKAPQPYGGLYSQAVIASGVVYCSGIVAIDPETGSLIDGDVKVHTVRENTPVFPRCGLDAHQFLETCPREPFPYSTSCRYRSQ